MLDIKLEKAMPERRRKKKPGLMRKLQGRTYRLPAHVTSDDDWQGDEPNIKLSRAFAVVLGIHVIAIGGFMAFELFRSKEGKLAGATTPASTRNSVRSQSTPVLTRPANSATRGVEPVLDDPANAGMRTYVVGAGESLGAIAAKFEVDERLLAEKNGLGVRRPFEAGMKLLIPNQHLASQTPADPRDLLEASTPPTPAPVEKAVEVASANESASKPATAIQSQGAASKGGGTAEPSSISVAADEKPVRRAELVRETSLAPNSDPKRPTSAVLAGARATANASAAATTAQKRADKKSPPSKSDASARASGKKKVHKVAEGDTAYAIARQYKVNVDELIRINNINPRKLLPGTRLVIPESSR